MIGRRTLTRLAALVLGVAAAHGSDPLATDRFTGAVLPLVAGACLLYLLISFAGRAGAGSSHDDGDPGGGFPDFFGSDGDGDGGD